MNGCEHRLEQSRGKIWILLDRHGTRAVRIGADAPVSAADLIRMINAGEPEARDVSLAKFKAL